jgi:Chaperonin GroEL (HSP60 family)
MVRYFSWRQRSNSCIGATILRQLEVEHPAAKVLVELSQLQDKEVGDGTTSVVIVAAELLRVNLKILEDLIFD